MLAEAELWLPLDKVFAETGSYRVSSFGMKAPRASLKKS